MITGLLTSAVLMITSGLSALAICNTTASNRVLPCHANFNVIESGNIPCTSRLVSGNGAENQKIRIQLVH